MTIMTNKPSWRNTIAVSLLICILASQSTSSFADEGVSDQPAKVANNVLLYFFADWAGPCQEMKPLISRLQRSGAAIRSINIDAEQELVRQFDIQSIPAFVVIIDGVVESSQRGKITETELQRLLSLLPKSDSTNLMPPDALDLEDQKFERRTRQVAAKLRSANAQDRPSLERQLQSLIQQHFEFRQSQRINEIKRLDERLAALRKQQDRREANKSQILKRRMTELVDPDTSRGWDEVSAENVTLPSDAYLKSDKGRNVSQTNPDSTTPRKDPTFQGTRLSEWIEALETERSPKRTVAALVAIQYLIHDAEPRSLCRAIIKMSNSRPESYDKNDTNKAAIDEHGREDDVTIQAVELLGSLPPPVVVDELIQELGRANRHSRGFRDIFHRLIECTQNQFEFSYQGFRFISVPNDSSEVLRVEIRRRSRRLIRELVKIADADHALDFWSTDSAYRIVRISRQQLKTYPELVPVAQRLFAHRETQYAGPAIDLLLSSGLNADGLVEAIDQDYWQNYRSRPDLFVERLSRMVSLSPDLVNQLVEKYWEKDRSQDGKNNLGLPQEPQFMPILTRVGDTAVRWKPLLPMFQSLAKSSDLDEYTKGVFKETIRKIEDAKPLEEPEPLPQEDIGDLPTNTSSGGPSTFGGTFTLRNDPPVQAGEQTYDGIPYSQWLKLLETERKPEKLISAIDACGRLAQENDTRRIIRGILNAASHFEGTYHNQNQEQWQVWTICTEALRRMPKALIVEELIAAFRDKVSYKSGRRFQLGLLDPSGLVLSPDTKPLAGDLLTALLSLMNKENLDSEDIIAAGTNVWGQSGQALAEFPDLERLALKAIDDGPQKPEALQFGGYNLGPWRTIVSNVIYHAPDTLDLAEKLRKHQEYADVIVLLRGLGPRASVLVPDLVERFLKVWKAIAIDESPDVNDKTRLVRRGSERSSCCNIAMTLGAIGPNERSATLLKEILLSTIADPRRVDDQQLREFLNCIEDNLKLADKVPSQDSNPILSDACLIQGHWQRENSVSNSNPLGENCFFRDAGYSLNGANGSTIPMAGLPQGHVHDRSRFEIDPTKMPKRISFFEYSYISDGSGLNKRVEERGTRREGIYELTELTLRIQVSKPGSPAPTAFVKEKSELPEGQFLYQFNRRWPPDRLE